MKNLILISLLCLWMPVISQEAIIIEPEKQIYTENHIYDSREMDVKPEFPGGLEALYKFIASEFKVPQDPDFKKGKLYMAVTIEKDGKLTNLSVIRDLGYGTGKEAIRVLKKSPKWKPGLKNGKAERSKFTFPIDINAV